jgi:hypothetical protein
VPKAARCLYPETKAGETWKKRLSRNHYDYRQSVARGAVVYKRAGVYWSRVHLPSRKSQKRHVQRKRNTEATQYQVKKTQPRNRERPDGPENE